MCQIRYTLGILRTAYCIVIGGILKTVVHIVTPLYDIGPMFYIFDGWFSTSLLNFLRGKKMAQPITSKLAVVAELMNQHTRAQNQALTFEVEQLAVRVSSQNRLIAQLQSDINNLIDALADAQRENQAFRNATRILYSADGTTALFARNSDGVFVQVSDVEPPIEEPPSAVARRLNFDSASDVETDDEFLMRLYGFIE